MLEGLDQIDWATLGEFQIPLWIRQLACEDKLMRKKAFGELSDDLTPWEVYDGLYSEELPRLVRRKATHLIIPFLIEMLESETIEGKDLILDLLHDLAWYNDVGKYVTEKEREEYEHHAQQLYDEVYKGVKIYRELAHSADPEVSQSAKSLLGILTLSA